MARALFLDRDGVINLEKNYLYRIKDFEFNKGIFDLCKYFQNLNYKVFIITNQSGIARGFYSLEDLKYLHDWMLSQFIKNKIIIDKIYFCPHHPEFDCECECRKPAPGMIFKARDEFNLNLKKSVLIGDKKTDIIAGKNAGVGNTFLIKTNKLLSNKNLINFINEKI
jgi:D-glycero-D-manno-heptose 1,7-bisphosphate phosphatase